MLSASKGNVMVKQCVGYHEGFNLIRFDVVNMTDLSLCKLCIIYNNPILGYRFYHPGYLITQGIKLASDSVSHIYPLYVKKVVGFAHPCLNNISPG